MARKMVLKGKMNIGTAVSSMGQVTKTVGSNLKELGGRKWMRKGR